MANQMFQIAATVGYARRHGREYHIPRHTINEATWKARFTNLANPKYPKTGSLIHIKERTHAYHELPHNRDAGRILLDGYWQSEKYFEHCVEEVAALFPFEYDRVMHSTVALHVRMGDYKNFPDHHPVVTKEYVKKSLDIVLGETNAKQVIILSDEPGLAKALVQTRYYPGVLFSLPNCGTRTDLDDFQTMLSCEHLIISNSTFSLMAAILNKRPDKIVISPSKENWFGPANKHLDTSTIIPESFTQIKY